MNCFLVVVTSVNLTNLYTPSTEVYGGSVPPASKKLMAVKKNVPIVQGKAPFRRMNARSVKKNELLLP